MSSFTDGGRVASASKQVLVQNQSRENEFDLRENEHARKACFYVKRFASGEVLQLELHSTRWD